MTRDNLDFYPQKIDRDINSLKMRESHAILFRRHNAVEIAVQAAIDKIDDLFLCISVVIGV
ncbi:MAG: hypothetical protein ACI9R3_004300, partial [Verrucomicrobiales bacterium]